MDPLRIGLLGGVPPFLGGGGLERQMRQTAKHLRARGHSVDHVFELEADSKIDLVHMFGNGADNWQLLEHWRRNRVPLVVSPIVVASPGRAERTLAVGKQLGKLIPNVSSMTCDVLRSADHVIALTGYERDLVRKLVGEKPTTVIDNGVNHVEPAASSPLASGDPFVLMLGSVSERKGQAQVLEQLEGQFRFAVVGGFEGDDSERADWESLVARTGVEWTDEIRDPAVVSRIVQDSAALLLFSSAEVQSLAVLEALAHGTPVVASDLPSHKELAERWPGWLAPVGNIADAAPALRRAIDSPPQGALPDVPTWDDVAEQIEGVYTRVLASTSS